MTSQELREKFLEFFESKGHVIIPSAPLVPANDPTVIFTTAGMHPLVPYLLGEEHHEGRRLTSVQKCIRTGDIDEVGDNTHLTFFEMLGNWSLGDYWKKEAIAWSYEFLTDKKWLGLPKERLAVSCFSGDNDAPQDTESADLWLKLGIPNDRIAFLGKEDNWWGPAGNTGPCGPDTEMFYWIGDDPAPVKFDTSDKRWVEIWNDVFMQYNKTNEAKYEPLKQKNVDTGMGLERTLVALNGYKSVYDTDLFSPLLKYLEDIATTEVDEHKLRVIVDHMRAVCFMAADGVVPSNKDRGYVMRRLIRRSLVYTRQLGISSAWIDGLVELIVKIFASHYSELKSQTVLIKNTLHEEAAKFNKTLDTGLKEFNKHKKIDGTIAFNLYQTFGFPWELSRELAQESGQVVDKTQFEAEFAKHQELSRTASAGVFKGGLADHTDEVVRLHTATHLMNAALRKVLGSHVWQKGSNITAERTRFDFTHLEKMTDEQKKEVEDIVNVWIARDLQVKKEIMPLEEAKKLEAIGVFGEKYAETVSVYTVYDSKTGEVISREFCGGPHVEHTGVIGHFKILKEEAVASGIRRIKASVN